MPPAEAVEHAAAAAESELGIRPSTWELAARLLAMQRLYPHTPARWYGPDVLGRTACTPEQLHALLTTATTTPVGWSVTVVGPTETALGELIASSARRSAGMSHPHAEHGRAAPTPPFQNTEVHSGLLRLAVDSPGAHLSLIAPGLDCTDESAPALTVLNTALAGPTSSRLTEHIRRGLALAYVLVGQLDLETGHITITAEPSRGKADRTIAALVSELSRVADEPPSASELIAARRRTLIALLSRTTTGSGMASLLDQLSVLGLPATYWAHFIERVEKVSAAELPPLAALYQPHRFAGALLTGSAQYSPRPPNRPATDEPTRPWNNPRDL